MNSKVVQFRKSDAPKPQDQLDFFDIIDREVIKYKYFNIDEYDQHKIIDIIIRFDFSLAIDMRKFPIFSKPKYDHKEFLSSLKEKGFEYIPLIYICQFHPNLSEIKNIKRKVLLSKNERKIMIFYDNKEMKRSDIGEWNKNIKMKFHNLIEMIQYSS